MKSIYEYLISEHLLKAKTSTSTQYDDMNIGSLNDDDLVKALSDITGFSDCIKDQNLSYCVLINSYAKNADDVAVLNKDNENLLNRVIDCRDDTHTYYCSIVLNEYYNVFAVKDAYDTRDYIGVIGDTDKLNRLSFMQALRETNRHKDFVYEATPENIRKFNVEAIKKFYKTT